MVQKTHPELLASNLTNHLVNGGFRIWQRGTSFSSVSRGTKTADRWVARASTSGTTGDINQTTDAKYGSYAIQVNDPNSSERFSIGQIIENSVWMVGSTITLSGWVKDGPNGSSQFEAFISARDSTDSQLAIQSASFEPTSTYQGFNIQLDVPSNTDDIEIQLTPQVSGAGEAIFDGITVTVGDEPVNYPKVTRPIGIEQTLAERYYETQSIGSNLTNSSVDKWRIMRDTNNTPTHERVQSFNTSKAAVPTVTFTISEVLTDTIGGDSFQTDTSNWSVSSTISSTSQWGVLIERSASTTDQVVALRGTMEAEVT